MWAWARGGVSLPHSSQAQYDSIPHVAQSDVQPGDLVFFGSPIHHVGIYIGGGQMISAPHTGDVVKIQDAFRSDFVGAGRP
jgi:cell wall-associated NlpC family hydrolase